MRFPILLASMMASLPMAAQSGPEVIWATNVQYPSGVAFSTDGARLGAVSPNDYWYVWNVPGGALVRARSSPNASFSCVALSSDGSLVTIGHDDGKTSVWRISDGVRLWLNGPDNEIVYSVSCSPDGIYLVDGLSDGIHLHYVQSGQGFLLAPVYETIYDAVFSPDSLTFASAHAGGAARLWAVPSDPLVATNSLLRSFIGHSNEVYSVDFSPDGKLLATASADGTARIWNVTNAQPLVVMDGGGGRAKFTADGKYLFTFNDGTFKIWRVSGGAYVGSITNTAATTFDIAKNGKYFAYGRSDGAVVLARMPLIVDEVLRSGAQTILKWQGGSGLYQLQSRTNLTSGSWENVGNATTNTTVTNITSSTLYFRVQSLPNP